MESPLWTEGASPWPHERDALAFVRARLPNYEPCRAWTNVEFIAEELFTIPLQNAQQSEVTFDAEIIDHLWLAHIQIYQHQFNRM